MFLRAPLSDVRATRTFLRFQNSGVERRGPAGRTPQIAIEFIQAFWLDLNNLPSDTALRHRLVLNAAPLAAEPPLPCMACVVISGTLKSTDKVYEDDKGVTERVRLRKQRAALPFYPSLGDWRRHADEILKINGPKW